MALGFAVAGCGAKAGMGTPGDGGTTGTDDAGGGGDGDMTTMTPADMTSSSCPSALAFVTGQSQKIGPGASVDLHVRLADCHAAPTVGATVKYDVANNNGGAKVSALSAQTDTHGDAFVTLTGGTSAATFDVTVSTSGASSLVFHITVGAFTTGTIDVTLDYGGKQAFSGYQAFLYRGPLCSKIDPFNMPGPAIASSAMLASILDRPEFQDLTPASDYTVVALANVQGKILGFGCTDSQTVTAGGVTQVGVTIGDIAVAFGGLYKLDNHFDLSSALPPSVATAISILYEATNDKGDPGNGNPGCDPNAAAPRYCGTDPAAFMLDFVYRQMCHWECNPSDSFSGCVEMNHPLGDISALYLHNFMNWANAIPYAFGMCGALTTLHPKLEPIVQNAIEKNVPSLALKILNIAGDLAGAIKAMHITSELLISSRTERQGNFTHTLKEMIVTVHDFADPPNAITKTFLLSAAGLTALAQNGSVTAKDGVLTIPDHSFQLDFGKLVWYLYSSVILPTVGQSLGQTWTKTEDMLHYVINCNRCNPPMGQPGLGCQISMLTNNTLFDDKDYEGFCNLGLAAAGAAVDAKIKSMVNVQTILTINGTAEADMVNSQQIADALKNGKWNGKWVEGSATGTFPGTFTGKR